MNKVMLAIKKIISILFPLEWSEKFIVFTARLTGVNLLRAAYRSVGVLKFQNFEISGELHVITTVIPDMLIPYKNSTWIFFDIGANIGDFSCELARAHPQSEIYSFEPCRLTFQNLAENVVNYKNIHPINYGAGSAAGSINIFTYRDEINSAHATLYAGVMTNLHKSNDIIHQEVQLITIDEFVQDRSIDFIHFLKVDTEGHELEVLKGAQKMIDAGRIKIIQFEFNEMNIISRVFLKDFYELLRGYKFYRMDSKKLIELGQYRSEHEIFQIHNLLAVLQ